MLASRLILIMNKLVKIIMVSLEETHIFGDRPRFFGMDFL